jgi:uncharacterized protein DUF2865
MDRGYLHTLVTIAALHRGQISKSCVSRLGSCSMIETVTLGPARRLGVILLALGALSAAANAQQPPQAYPGAPARNPACVRLEAQLVMVDRGDPAKADQVKRLEDTAARQQADLDRITAQARRTGCEGGGFFSLFSGQPQQCGPINNQIQQARANLDRLLSDIQNLQGNSADREGQRRTILASLAQYDCGPQYQAYANRGGFFENLFGPGTIIGSPAAPDAAIGNTYRTLCVRTCDGYYFPVSYSTVPSKFADEEKVCQAMCPASEAVLYSHRNPGEDVSQAVSNAGRTYTELPNAFAYRKAFNSSCSCRAAGQTWADALKQLDDQTVERGDIVVNEERAKLLSQPQTDAQGKPIKPAPRSNAPAAKATATPAAVGTPVVTEQKPAEGEPGKRKVRTVGPTFIPVR